MSDSGSQDISWGDTPLGYIARRSSGVELSSLPLRNLTRARLVSEPEGHGSYRKHVTSSPSIQRRYHRPKMRRQQSAPSSLNTLMSVQELETGRQFIKTLSMQMNDEVFVETVNDTNGDAANKVETTEDKDEGICFQVASKIQYLMKDFLDRRRTILTRVFKLTVMILYFVYFGYAMYYRFGDEGSVRLLVCTLLGVLLLLLNQVSDSVWLAIDLMCVWKDNRRVAKIVRWVFYIAAVIAIILTLVILVATRNPRNLLSLPGLAGFILLTYLTSTCPSKVHWHPVFWGLAIQYFCGLIIMRMEWGLTTSEYLEDRIVEFLLYTKAGAQYLFGEELYQHSFVFMVLSVTVFFSTTVSVLYHYGVMQAIIRVFGRTLSFCFQTSPVEALNLVGNIFIGFTEAPLMIRPFLPIMTRSELHSVMTAGFATVTGTMLPIYAEYGVPVRHLIAACIMSAPAALAISKLSCPETQHTRSSLEDYLRLEGRHTNNVIEAITKGATSSVKLVASVAVNVLAFICVFNFLNATLIWFGDRVGVDKLSFQFLCSYLLYPVALFMGVDPIDCRSVAGLVGVKIFTNELSAYSILSGYYHNRAVFENYTARHNYTDWYSSGDDVVLPAFNNTVLIGGILSERSEVITTYALCGFSNVGSMGIMLGILGALAPEKKLVLTQIVVRALVAGNIACFITACTAGLLHRET